MDDPDDRNQLANSDRFNFVDSLFSFHRLNGQFLHRIMIPIKEAIDSGCADRGFLGSLHDFFQLFQCDRWIFINELTQMFFKFFIEFLFSPGRFKRYFTISFDN